MLLFPVQQRPKKLLVLINPVSGGSKGRSVYERKVAPIFRDAGIETEVIGKLLQGILAAV